MISFAERDVSARMFGKSRLENPHRKSSTAHTGDMGRLPYGERPARAMCGISLPLRAEIARLKNALKSFSVLPQR